MELYGNEKERQGVIRRSVVTPDTMAHFHIEAFGDKIQSNRYESAVQQPDVAKMLSSSDETNQLKFNLMNIAKLGAKSSNDLYRIGGYQNHHAMRISLNGIQKMGTNVEQPNLSAQHSARVSDRSNSVNIADSQDSVFSTTMNTLREQF